MNESFFPKQSQNIILKILSISSFSCICIALLIILYVGPAICYEISIYDIYPWHFWALLFAAISIGQLLILICTFYQIDSRCWIWGIIAIVLSDLILLFMPIIRNYHNFGSGDVLTHIGYLRDILITSNIGTNPYPIDHILGISIYFFSGITFEQISMTLPVFFSFFFMLSIYILGKIVIKNNRLFLLYASISTILYFGAYNIYFLPNAQAILILPFFIYLILKGNDSADKIDFQILIFLISILSVFFHPLVTMVVILLLFSIKFLQIFYSKKFGNSSSFFRVDYLIILILSLFCIWGMDLLHIVRKATPIFEIIMGIENVSQFERYSNLISTVTVDYFYLIKLILMTYGQYIIFGILSFLCIFILIYYFVKNKKSIPFILFYIIFIACFFYSISVFFLFIGGSVHFIRFLRFALIFSIMFIPLTIYITFQQYSVSISPIKMISIVFIILTILTFFSMFNLYDSPFIKKQNQQNLKSDFLGMKTFFNIRDTSSLILEQGISQYRFSNAINGVDKSEININYNEKTVPVDHFGYNNSYHFHSIYNNKYLLLTDRGIQYYPKIFPEFEQRWRFTDSDYLMLKYDNHISQIYQNGNFQVFRTI